MSEFDYTQQQKIHEQEDRTYARPVGSVFPTFFVGIGGAGCKIVDRIQALLRGRLDFKDRYEKLVQFMAFDTDQDDLKELDLKHKFLISDFPKGEFVAAKLGGLHQPRDSFFAQWWPEWYPTRPDSVKGAGQIRVESRLSLYYQLENDRAKIISQITDAAVCAKDHDNPYRQVRPAQAYVHFFCSNAGGTGSGGLLTLAYVFRECLEAQRLNPMLVAHVLLPPLFYRKVRSRLHDDIKSNGYAFLKELEWFMTLGYNNNPRLSRGDVPTPQEDFIEYNFNPNNRPGSGNQKVTLPPFHLVNLIDEPGDISFADPADIYPAIAGAAYVELFSPILGGRESEEDNYYKKIKHLEGGFSLNYGAFGLSMLVLPDRDILTYCVNRMLVGLLGLLGGDAEGTDDARFLESMTLTAVAEIQDCAGDGKQSQVKQQRTTKLLAKAGILDAALGNRPNVKDVLLKGWPEVTGPAATAGMYRAVERLLADRVKGISDTANAVFDTLYKRNADDVPEHATGEAGGGRRAAKAVFAALREAVRRGFSQSQQAAKVTAEQLNNVGEAMKKSGELEGEKCGPLEERLALIWTSQFLKGELEKVKAREVEVSDAENPFDEDAFEALWQRRGMEKLIPLGFGVKDDWAKVEDLIKDYWTECMTRKRDEAIAVCRSQVQAAVKGWADERLKEFKELNPVLRTIVKGVQDKLTREGTRPSDGQMTDEYVLDDEVMQGVRTRRRHWDRLFNWLVKVRAPRVKSADVEIGFEEVQDEIRPKISAALALQAHIDQALCDARDTLRRESEGRQSELPEARRREVVENAATLWCRQKLTGLILGTRQAGDRREDKGLLIDDCLELEARFELEELYLRDHLANYSDKVHPQDLLTEKEKERKRKELIAKFEPHEDDVRAYVDEKIKFISDKARELARLRLTETTKVDPFVFVCLHYKHYREKMMFGNTKSLWEVIREGQSRFREARDLPGWVDEKRVAFYTAQAGLPVHNFWPVNAELKGAYERIYREYVTGEDRREEPRCDFPSHTDRNFEDPHRWDPHEILPSLDPAREVGRRRGGLETFMELLALGVVRRMPAEGGKDLPATFRATLKKAIEAERVREGDKPAEVWVLDGQVPKRPARVDPVLVPMRRPFLWVLGDRIDRAFEGYESEFLRKSGNTDRVAHLEELFAQRKQAEAEREDPVPFRKHLEAVVNEIQAQYVEEAEKLETGHRNRSYVSFLESAVACLRNVYLRYKGTGAERDE